MFTKTLTLTDLKSSLSPSFTDVTGSRVYQVIQRGQPIKVILTQEYYLRLRMAEERLKVLMGHKQESPEPITHLSDDALEEKQRDRRKRASKFTSEGKGKIERKTQH